MKKMVQLVFVLFSLGQLVSCKEEIKECSDAFVQSYEQVRSSYLQAYRFDSDEHHKQTLVGDLQAFLSEYDEVKCKLDGKELEPGPEMKIFLSQLESKHNKKELKALVPKVIYGDDDRIDVPDSDSELLQKLASSTAAMIEGSKIGNDLSLPNETLGESFDLCPGERFAEQINPAICSGFLVRSDILVTAGHCITTQADCDNYKWVFGFYKGAYKLTQDQIFSCKKILKTVVNSKHSGNGADFAVIQLDRKVGGVSPLKFRENGTAGDGEQLVVIGHPSGLPTKIAGGAKIRSGEEAYFTANLDTFGGNSGSAVFNATTGIVEGILVRGELDYVSDIVDGKVCKRANKCSDDGCDGEDVTRITSVEGIPVGKTPTLADVKDNIFQGKYAVSSMGGIIPFYSLPIDDNVIGGRKFLDICGIQAAKSESPSTWYSNALGKCSEIQDEIEMVYQDFTDSL